MIVDDNNGCPPVSEASSKQSDNNTNIKENEEPKHPPTFEKQKPPAKGGKKEQFLSVPSADCAPKGTRRNGSVTSHATTISFDLEIESGAQSRHSAENTESDQKVQRNIENSEECRSSYTHNASPKPLKHHSKKTKRIRKRGASAQIIKRKISNVSLATLASQKSIYDTTGLFHWCPTKKLQDVMLV